ncbi:MAG TPA: TIGR03809 family protein [Bradyrhizobium sp.]|nr:TIGR03809 family protein [Bradyrhizobium sp.]
MTHQLDVAGGREVMARWCALAEQRLEYLAELFETGRWRRFHSEHALLENIEEAKVAVKTWRELSSRQATSDNRPIDKSWLDRTSAAVTQRRTWRDPTQLPWSAKNPAEVLEKHAEIPLLRLPDNSSVPDDSGLPVAALSGETSRDNMTLPLFDLAATIAQRYPLLRNRL